MGHSFGGLVLSNTISHSILDASSTGARNASPWDMAVAFNPADDSIGTRQLMSELDYLYQYDPSRGAYVGRTPGAEEGAVTNENRPLLIVLQSENDQATGKFFPIGQSRANTVNLHYHWDKVPVPGGNGQKVSEGEFQTHTPGNDKYLVNFNVVPLGGATPPSGLKTYENRAFEANLRQNVRGRTFFTSEKNNVTKNNSVRVRNTIQMRHALRQETKTGSVGNLSTAAMHVCPAGSYAYLRRSFGVTEDCEAITR
jgi:hypothetical protein